MIKDRIVFFFEIFRGIDSLEVFVRLTDVEGVGDREQLVQVKDSHGTVNVDTTSNEVHIKKLRNSPPQLVDDFEANLFLKIFILCTILDLGF